MCYISSNFLGDCQRFGVTSCLILQDIREEEVPVSLETPVIKIRYHNSNNKNLNFHPGANLKSVWG